MAGPEWRDEEAGSLVRPYALTRGRTRSSADDLDLIAMVKATGARPQGERALSPEHRRILELTGRPAPVADVAAELDLPLGVVRVLLGDLRDQGLISVRPAASSAPLRAEHILKEVINGLRAL